MKIQKCLQCNKNPGYHYTFTTRDGIFCSEECYNKWEEGNKETIPEKNRRMIEELWDGKHSIVDWCETCEYDGEDEHYLRYCNKYCFGSYAMTITNCIGYRENIKKGKK